MPSVALPKGGGAIRGVGEKFSTNALTGGATMTVPLAVSPGRAGAGPELSLSYDSGSGNGPFGFGWSLSVPRISRKTDKGLPRYRDAEESDVFLLSGAEDLVPVLLPDGRRHDDVESAPGFTIHRYRPRVEGLFARIERWTETATGDVHWRAVTRENVTTLYGRDNRSRVFDPVEDGSAHPARIFEWLACESYDDKGNLTTYHYEGENDAGVDRTRPSERNRARTANRYLKRIRYGNRVSRLVQADLSDEEWLFEVVFDYDEGHYRESPLDASRPPAEQHRFVRATAATDGNWSVRPDPFSVYRAGFEVRSYRRCRRALMFHRFVELGPDPCLVRATEFDYEDRDLSAPGGVDGELEHQGSTRYASFIRRITQSGYVRDEAAPVEVVDPGAPSERRYSRYLKQSLPPLEFEYSKARIRDDVRELDTDGLSVGLGGGAHHWVDLDGEGLAGILARQGGAWSYRPNLGDGTFGAARILRDQPSLFADAGGHELLDLSGDGQLDVVAFAGPTPGFYERTLDRGWEPFRPFPRLPRVAWDDPNLRFVDLSGDGHADALVLGDEVSVWYPSLAEEGFGSAQRVRKPWDEETGPRLVFSDGVQSVYLADMSGDGLADLVRIGNGAICYWPNLGHGRFGAKVTMEGAPWFDRPDRFDRARIRLADLDGSGTTDIVYLGRDGARLYFNQAGNAWSEARLLPGFPRVDDLSSVVATDLFGRGTACLVWTSPLAGSARNPVRYVDLMGGDKPHLLTRSVNNLGAETRVSYASSSQFYLRDEREGRPWITRIPFPVHVVERVETYDHVGQNRFVTRYAYHHGYFDGHEREFRGFGLVEQFDTEELAALGASDAFPPGANLGEVSHVPPVLTKTWFHTGVYLGRDHVSNFFAGLLDPRDTGEYFREPGLDDRQARALLLEDSLLPAGLSLDEEREACRALRGSVLRRELYALDGSDKQRLPYVVTEQSFGVRCIQPRGQNRHGVFLAHAREELGYHYERALVPVRDGAIVERAAAAVDSDVQWRLDPRILHALTLEVDSFGNVLKSATVGYGRRFVDRSLEALREAQVKTLVSYDETRFTNAVDAPASYRAPLAYDARSYELTGFVPTGPAGRFRHEDFVAPDPGEPSRSRLLYDEELAYERAPGAGRQRRLLEHLRTLFRRDDLRDALPLGRLESMGLPFETYRLALTPGLIERVFNEGGGVSRLSPAMLDDGTSRGGYVHARDESGTSDGDFWIPSGRLFFSPDAGDTADHELAHARAHFFLPRRARDPFHAPGFSSESFVEYDEYDLLTRETRDAAGNRVTAGERDPAPTRPLVRQGNDYRVLCPALVMDANRNRIAFAFDALGQVAGTAVMGKPEDEAATGDRLTAAFRPDLTLAELEAFFAAPKGPLAAELLADATTRVISDWTAFWRTRDAGRQTPAFAATLARETHASDPAPAGGLRIRTALSYSDGFGREVQKKVQAERGPVPLRDPSGAILVDGDNQPRPTPAAVSPRWVGSSWTVFNNKGKPVRQYEPYFTDTHGFEFDVRIGKSPTIFYDAVGRVVAKLHPDHTWEKVVFGPWHEESWDASDTVLIAEPRGDADVGDFFARIPEGEYLPTWYARRRDGALGANQRAAARASELYAATPTVSHADSLGRAVVTVAHNRFRYSNAAGGAPPTEEFHVTRLVLDIEGNQREIVDASERVVVRYEYDLAGNRVRQSSMEAGERWMLDDVAGKPLYAWTGRGQRLRSTYDVLQRPTGAFLQEALDPSAPELLVARAVYGESRPNPEASNLRGKLVDSFDQAGVLTNDGFDFKGNVLRSSRRLAEAVEKHGERVPAHRTTLDWSAAVTFRAETYVAYNRYDALNRPVQLVAPHSDAPGAKINVVQPSYNDANLLERVEVWLDHGAVPALLLDSRATAPSPVGVADIEYDAQGRRLRIEYANAVSTRYRYDPDSFRLIRLYTRRGEAFSEDCEGAGPASVSPDEPPAAAACGVQNLEYTYDVAGNITHVHDRARQSIYFRNARIDPSADYVYDALFRLIEATGREHLGLAGGPPAAHSYDDAPRTGLAHPNDGNALGRYLERYVYDAVGNVLSLQHRGYGAGSPGWTRTYTYDEPSQLEPGRRSNRLTSTRLGDGARLIETYSSAGDGYDAHGNMLRMPQLSVMQWNERDQLRMTQRQAVNRDDATGTERQGERTWYVYDATGQRVRKVTELASGALKDERIYLGGFEIHRNAASGLVRETLHVMDDARRIALVETRTSGSEPGIPAELVRYQLGNHLESATLELDAEARVLSYEEYAPYGSTTYQAVQSELQAPKRYRYTGMERDEESGLSYHSARYYVPWLARWASTDPSGLQDGVNLYEYGHGSPLSFLDAGGTTATDFIRWHKESGRFTAVDTFARSIAHHGIDDTLRAAMELGRPASFFGPLAQGWGDPGFRPELSDTVGSQIGHFLEAVAFGYRPEILDQPIGHVPTLPSIQDVLDPGETDLRRMSIRLMIGHEGAGDPGRPGSGRIGAMQAFDRTSFRYTWFPSAEAILDIDPSPAIRAAVEVYRTQYDLGQSDEYQAAFEAAVGYVRSLGPEGIVDIDELTSILEPIVSGLDIPNQSEDRARVGGERVGNSVEDLRLSVMGFAFGEALRDGSFFRDENQQYRWIMRNIHSSESD